LVDITNNLLPPLPVALYIHIPWCERKCPYCDFNSHAQTSDLPEVAYVDALLADLRADIAAYPQPITALHSIFIGGGTPSLFSAEAIQRLLEGIDQQIGLSAQTEITLEANPGSAEQNRFRDYRLAGVNRISLGIQSFNDAHLNSLGRIHDGKTAQAAIAAVRKAGLDNFNLDLMFALPQQSVVQALQDLALAIQYQAPHLSWYQLTIEPNTWFHHHPPAQIPDDDLSWDIQQAGQAYLAEQGYQQYEISAYTLAQKPCQHNLNYWQFGDYLGIGAGAHSKWTDTRTGKIQRHTKQRHPQAYLNSQLGYRHDSQQLNDADKRIEIMLNGLRLNQGIPLAYLSQRTGLAFEQFQAGLDQAKQQAWLIEEGDMIRPTELGQRFLNDLLLLFDNQ